MPTTGSPSGRRGRRAASDEAEFDASSSGSEKRTPGRRTSAKAPAKKAAAKKAPAKKAAGKRSVKKAPAKKAAGQRSVEKAAAKKAPVKRSVKKAAAKKAPVKRSAKKAAAKKPAGRKAPAKKAAVKKPAAKKPAGRRSVEKAAAKKAPVKRSVKKAAAKKPAGRKAPAKKAAAKKAAVKKGPAAKSPRKAAPRKRSAKHKPTTITRRAARKRPARRSNATKPLIGWREWVVLPEFTPTPIKAKVDSGAVTSSLHAFNLQISTEGGQTMARFGVAPKQGSHAAKTVVEHPIVGFKKVRSSNGQAELRPVIRTVAVIGEKSFDIDITLASRDAMGFRMLLGRRAVRNRFVIDPGRSFLQPAIADGEAAATSQQGD